MAPHISGDVGLWSAELLFPDQVLFSFLCPTICLSSAWLSETLEEKSEKQKSLEDP